MEALRGVLRIRPLAPIGKSESHRRDENLFNLSNQ